MRVWALVFHQSPGGTFTHFTCEHFGRWPARWSWEKRCHLGRTISRALHLRILRFGRCWAELRLSTHEPVERYRVVQQITRRSDAFPSHGGTYAELHAIPQGAAGRGCDAMSAESHGVCVVPEPFRRVWAESRVDAGKNDRFAPLWKEQIVSYHLFSPKTYFLRK
jgi:hypothetical protein